MSKAAELAKLGEVMTNSQIGGRKNIVINGAMNISQRSTGVTSISSDDYYTLDRYLISMGNTAGRFTMEQVADVHDGFANAMRLTCTTADTSIASNERLLIKQSFEGKDLQHIKKGTSEAEQLTLSFYVKGDASATYTCEIADDDNTRYVAQEFPVTTEWVRIVRTFVADTTGTFDDDNAKSMSVNFWLHAGSDFTGGTFSSNTVHTTGNQRVGDNQTSFLDSTDRRFFITGIQLEVGSTATPFEHRSYGDELYLCQRYFEVSGTGSDNPAGYHFKNMFVGISQLDAYVQGQQFKVEKRADATVTLFSRAGTSGKVSAFDTGSDVANNHAPNVTGSVGFHAVQRNTGTYTVGKGYEYGYTAEAEL